MEKWCPHYRLAEILDQMVCVEAMNLTTSAARSIRILGMHEEQALAVIRGLTHRHFHKSMTTNHDHRVWQDVYHTLWGDVPLYVKFQRRDEFFVISFKERES